MLGSSQMKMRKKGAGKNQEKATEAEGPDNLERSHVVQYHWRVWPVPFMSATGFQWRWGELLKGLQRVQHSEAALQGPGTQKRMFMKLNPAHFFFFL